MNDQATSSKKLKSEGTPPKTENCIETQKQKLRETLKENIRKLDEKKDCKEVRHCLTGFL